MNTYHHEDLKSELIEAGLKMVKEEGLDNLSLRKLSRCCNVSEAAPYSHFKNKEELIGEMQRYAADKMYEALYRAYETVHDKESPECILELGIAYVLFAVNHPDYFNFIFGHPYSRIDLSMKSVDGIRPFEFFKEKCFEIYGKQGFSEEKIKIGVISMWAKAHGIASIASMKNVDTDFEWEDILREVILE